MLIIQEFATALRMKAVASAAEMGLSQCGEMRELDVMLAHVTKLALHHVPKAQLVICAIVFLATKEITAINALMSFGERQWTAR